MNNEHLKQIVSEAKRGSSRAFGEIYDFLLDRIYRFLYFRVGAKEVAEDLAEEVFLKAWQGLKNYQEKGIPFEAWLFRIAHNQLIDFYRSKRQQVSLDKIIEMEDRNPGPDKLTEINLTKELVLASLKKLRHSYREVIVLKFIEEKENQEISYILGRPVPHVRVLQNRALQALRKLLKKYENK